MALPQPPRGGQAGGGGRAAQLAPVGMPQQLRGGQAGDDGRAAQLGPVRMPQPHRGGQAGSGGRAAQLAPVGMPQQPSGNGGGGHGAGGQWGRKYFALFNWCMPDTAKLTGPRTLADKRGVGPVKLLCIIMFDISKIRPKSISGPVKA